MWPFNKISRKDIEQGWERLKKEETILAFERDLFQREKDLISRENRFNVDFVQKIADSDLAAAKAEHEEHYKHCLHDHETTMLNQYIKIVEKVLEIIPQLKTTIEIDRKDGKK